MLKRNNTLSVVIVLIFCGLSGYAQQDLNNNNTTSPYSRYGLGDLNHYGYGRTAAMGGASLGSRHAVQINSANPATYNSNDSLSFIFEFGVDGKFSNYKSNTGTMKASDVNFRYFSLSFPINKWIGAGMGIQPYSNMGNEVAYSETLPDIGKTYYNYIGEGSTSKAYFGASVMPVKGLSLGANLNYTFGRLNQNSKTQFDDASLFEISSTEGTRLSDFTLTYGLQYDYQLKKNQYLTLGATFEKQSDFTTFHRIFSYKTITVGTSSLIDTIQFRPESKDIIQLPSTIGIGLSYNKVNKLEINADYYYAGWSKCTFYGETDKYLTNQSRFSAGFEYIPEAYSIRSYMKRVKYRAGIHHEKSYLVLNNHQIKETGVSFGAGLPFPKSKSTANFGFEVGKQGTTEDDLVQNIYTKFSLYLNLYDYWFIKRKFD
jgi:hypothetical protein